MSDLPDLVAPGEPVEAIWGNDVVEQLAWLLDQINTLLPVGMVCMYAGDDTPPKFLMCRGAAVSTTTYSLLFSRVGHRFSRGLPDPPAGTFRLPNMQARYPVGFNNGSALGIADTFWKVGVGEHAGSYDGTLPAHKHVINIVSRPANREHYHRGMGGVGTRRFMISGADENNDTPLHYLPRGVGTDIGGPEYFSYAQMTDWNEQTHEHAVKGETEVEGTGSQGNNIPPGVSFNFIIRAL